MERIPKARRLLSVCTCLMLLGQVSRAADWPAYRADSARTAKTPEKLQYPLALVWKYVPAQKPQPAWPDPASIRIRGKNFDVAPQPIIVGGLVYFGSTTDDTLWALNATTGKAKWAFTTDGPIRFAPAIADGKAYLVSDDGLVYCLDAATGKLIWKFRGGLNDRKIIGNGRMISRWPIRSGVAVHDGVVHFAVGMWSAEGVYVFALDAKTGKEIWCNDTNLDYLTQPHSSYAMTGNMPQGYLAVNKDKVVYNNGVAGNWSYDTKTGGALGRVGGAATLKWTKGSRRAVYSFSLLVLNEQTGDIVHGGLEGEAESQGIVSLHAALAGETLIKCDGNQIIAVDGAGKGKQVWQHEFEGTASGIAVGNGLLVVTSADGAIHCFKSGGSGKPALVGPVVCVGGAAPKAKPTTPGSAEHVLAELAKRKLTKGFALILGEKDAALAEALAAQTELKVICALSDKARVDAERKRLRETTGLYGTGVMVDYLADAKELPYPQYFANLIVASQKPDGLSDEELDRVLRPCGGILLRDGNVSVKGKLPGALDWDSKVTSDQRVRGPLELLWFGEPGPRHTAKTTNPIAANGRMFVMGRDAIIAVDAYNGTILWTKECEKGTSVVADDHYAYLNGKTAGILDAQTGEPVKGGAPQNRPRLAIPRRSEEDEQKYLSARTHPLTGGMTSKAHHKTHGCSAWTSSVAMEFFRSSTLGYYDYEDDSGLRNFGGMRPGCGDSLLPALGLLLAAESTGIPHGTTMGSNCSCSYSYKTSLALAPAASRRNENWALFQDVPWVMSGGIRHAALNFGAPGDRRDDERTLWLAGPRPQGIARHGYQISISVPYSPEFYDGFHYFRRNSDRLQIERTDKPWLYVSGYLGLRRMSWDLDYYDRRTQYLSVPVANAPAIDGNLTEACWTRAGEIVYPFVAIGREHKGQVASWQSFLNEPRLSNPVKAAYVRHDDNRLYLAYRKRVVYDRRGKGEPIKANTKGKDAPVWQDDALEVYLADSAGGAVIHLGVSASGATYDGLIKVPPATTPGGAKKPTGNVEPREDSGWNGVWTSAVTLNKESFVVEIAVPWKTLQNLGIDKSDLKVNFSHNLHPYRRKPFDRTALQRSRKLNISGQKPTAKPYTVHLHFAEPANDRAGQRVFDVVLGDRVVLKDFDVFAEAGGKHKALVKEIHGVPATQNLVVELIAKGEQRTESSVPILCGMEIIAEQPGAVPDPVLAHLVRGGANKKSFLLYSDFEKLTDKQKQDLEKMRQVR